MMQFPKPLALALTALFLSAAARADAQKSGQAAQRTGKAASPAPIALDGAWSGIATVQFGDSTITVPVMYTFVTANGVTGGTATVPGQGSGQISNVVREGTQVRFRVSAPEGRLLEHDGQVGDQHIEGMVYMDQKPLAKFRITPARAQPKSTPKGMPRSTSSSTTNL
jgi:hypothetical protein